MKSLFTFLFLAVTIVGLAQKRDTLFIKNDETVVSTKDSADLIRIVTHLDNKGKLYLIKDYFKSGKLQMEVKSTSLNTDGAEGEEIDYYENGNKESVSYNKEGEPIGNVYGFFPNGKPYYTQVFPEKPKDTDLPYLINSNFDSLGVALVTDGNGYYKEYDCDFKYLKEEGPVKNGRHVGEWKFRSDTLSRVEIYDDSGKRISGKATNLKTGETKDYTKDFVLPVFPGGINGLIKYLQNTIVYPESARQRNIEGRVLVNFMVEPSGKVTNVVAATHINPAIDSEAIRIIKNSPLWTPGLQYGFPVRARYTVPIVFNLTR